MKPDENFTPFEDFDNLTGIGASISYKFAGVFEKDRRKTKSTYYLAKALNTNISVLKLISDSFNDESDVPNSLDISSIYSLLRNLLEICNIYWYFIDDYSNKENFDLKLSIYEYHDTLSSKIIYNTLFYSIENELHFNKKEFEQLSKIQNNVYYKSLDKNIKNQIIKGNKSMIWTQFEIAEKRGIDIAKFKAYYKIFSAHTHSSPTAMKNLTSLKTNNNSENFEIKFMFLSLNYISKFISNMILSIIELWKLTDINLEDLEFLKKLNKEL